MGEFEVGVKVVILYGRKVLLVQCPDTTWEFPGGKVEFGEDLYTALHREIKEETDLDDIYNVQLLYAESMRLSPEKQAIGLLYLCHSKSDKVKMSDEHINITWANKEQMISMLSEYMLNEMLEHNILIALEID